MTPPPAPTPPPTHHARLSRSLGSTGHQGTAYRGDPPRFAGESPPRCPGTQPPTATTPGFADQRSAPASTSPPQPPPPVCGQGTPRGTTREAPTATPTGLRTKGPPRG